MRKISPPPGFDPRTVQHVGSRYTDWAVCIYTLKKLTCDRQSFVKESYPNSMKIRTTTSKTDGRTGVFCIQGICLSACHVTRRTFVQWSLGAERKMLNWIDLLSSATSTAIKRRPSERATAWAVTQYRLVLLQHVQWFAISLCPIL
jgi:hypothetical protein